MARRVYLHVGVPKSGTTFLQTLMWSNRPRLEAQGFLYPGRSRMDHYHASQVVRGTPPHRLGSHADSWDRLVDALAHWDGTGLVSHEFFSMASGREARKAVRALAPAEVHVVLTARDYVRQFPAVWQEALKMHWDRSLDEFMDHAFAFDLAGAWGWRSQDVPAVLARWAKAVPPERVHVVTVPPPGADRLVLWRRWCAVLGVDETGFDLDAHRGNESLGAPQAALLRRVKPFLTGPLREGPVRHRWVRGYFGHEVLVPQGGARFGLRDEHVAKLRQLSLDAAQAVESAGYDVVGDLADLVPAVDAGTNQRKGPHPDDVSDEEMLDVAAQAIDRMIQDVRRLTAQRNHWRSVAERRLTRRVARRLRRLVSRDR